MQHPNNSSEADELNREDLMRLDGEGEKGPPQIVFAAQKKNGWLKFGVRMIACAYAIVLSAFAAVLWGMGDIPWFLTLLVFGPRWLAGLPLMPLVLVQVFVDRRGLLISVMCALCLIGPIMGFCLPWRSLVQGSGPAGGVSVKFMTLNIGNMNRDSLNQYLRTIDADVVAFQEFPSRGEIPAALGAGWHFVRQGELAVASRFPIDSWSVSPVCPGRYRPAGLRCDVKTPDGVVHVHTLHLHTLRRGFEAITSERLSGLQELKRQLEIRNEESRICRDFVNAVPGCSVVLGDFNMPVESSTFRRDWGGWDDSFLACGLGFGYTFSTRTIGLRIDHILCKDGAWMINKCFVGPSLNGQHRPLHAEVFVRKDSSR